MQDKELPPLPEPQDLAGEWPEGHDDAAMTAYGRQCYEAALEAAAKIALDHRLSLGAEGCDVRDELAYAIRAMKSK